MEIDETSGASLCEHVMSTLEDQGLTLRAALQAAGCEEKTQGWIQQGIVKWLVAEKSRLLCLTEYLKIDFALIRPESVDQDRLLVDTIIEFKFNYTAQTPELLHRPNLAGSQIERYVQTHPHADGYLLYLLADHDPRPRGEVLADRGWRYLRTVGDGRFELSITQMQASAAHAGFVTKGHRVCSTEGWRLHLELFTLAPRLPG